MTPDELWLRTLCRHNDVAITDIQLSQLSRYRELLLDWNSKINLISRKDQDRIWDTHILLSLSYAFLVRFPDNARVLDLGTGGGLPGIPLAILHPACRFVLLDSIRKKTMAVAAMAEELGLQNVTIVNARAEEINHLPHHHNIYDIVTVRSVSDLSNLLAWGLPFLRRATAARTATAAGDARGATPPFLISLKGESIETELALARKAFPRVTIDTKPLVFRGSEGLVNQTDKQLIIVHP